MDVAEYVAMAFVLLGMVTLGQGLIASWIGKILG